MNKKIREIKAQILFFLPIEGGPPPGLLAVIPWPLFDNNMILFPVEPAAATVEKKFVKSK